MAVSAMKGILPLFLTYTLLFLLNACGGGGGGESAPPEKPQQRGSLISASKITSTRSILLPYNATAYKIIYSTIDANGKPIQASGLLSIPDKGKGQKSPILSYQHGTIFLNSQAPSNSRSTIAAINTLSGTGYIVSAPDYIGYGKSASQMHPYIHANSLATASIDMLRASQIFIAEKGLKTNGQLFLAGYSEGGYATLAMQKMLQEKHTDEFTITASAAGAGPFDLTETAKILANRTVNDQPAYMNFLLKAYDSIYQLGNVNEMYQAQYRTTINTFFDGNHSTSEINKNLNSHTAELFEPNFLATLQGDSAHIIKDKLALNNLYDWKPNAPTRFYHSVDDAIVPYSNAVKALQTMRLNGAKNVSLGDCAFGSHVNCAFPYVLDARDFFSNYANNL